MAKYYYGGVLLPEIPIVEGYPYCFIRKTNDTGYYDLVYSKMIPVYNGGSIQYSNGSYLGSGDCVWYRIQISTASTATNWTFNLSTSETWSLNANRSVIWSSTYIPNSDSASSVIYFYGSRPIPEYGYIPTAKFYFNGILLPEIPVVDGYPYAFIRKNNDTDFYDLIYSKLIPIYDGESHIGYTNGSVIGTGDCKWYRIQISTADDTTDWMFYLWTTDWWTLNSNRSVSWSNCNIPNGSATSSTIYFYGSEPEPESGSESEHSVKYLVRSDGILCTVIDDELAILEETELTAEVFHSHGFDELPDWSVISTLTNPEILYWQDSENELPPLTVTLTATPYPQSIITENIDLTHHTIVGISSITGEFEGSPLFACEFSGVWKEFDGASWIDENTGMALETLQAITFEQWDEAINGLSEFKIKFILDSADDKVTKLNVNFNVDVTQAT